MTPEEKYTLGIEEEFQIVDPQTRELKSHVSEMLEEGRMMLGEQVKPEMIQAQIEVGTGVCRNIQEARRDITRLRSIVSGLARVPLIGRGLRRLSTAALERSNPELASAVRKLERYGATKDPTRAQKAMSQLTAAERRAYLEAAGEQDSLPQPANRQQRRRMQRARRGR